MKMFLKANGFVWTLLAAVSAFSPAAAAQDPIVTPIIVNTAEAIIVKAVTHKPTGLAKFEGYVQQANVAQITARAQKDDLAIKTFSLSEDAAAKMQQVIDKGGYQYGDKVTIFYDAATMKAMKVKGKPSKPI